MIITGFTSIIPRLRPITAGVQEEPFPAVGWVVVAARGAFFRDALHEITFTAAVELIGRACSGWNRANIFDAACVLEIRARLDLGRARRAGLAFPAYPLRRSSAAHARFTVRAFLARHALVHVCPLLVHIVRARLAAPE